MSILKLINELDFKNEAELFQYFADSYYNGNFTQLEELARQINKTDRVKLLQYLKDTEQEDAREKIIELFM